MKSQASFAELLSFQRQPLRGKRSTEHLLANHFRSAAKRQASVRMLLLDFVVWRRSGRRGVLTSR